MLAHMHARQPVVNAMRLLIGAVDHMTNPAINRHVWVFSAPSTQW